jgi:phosphosulfolactate synthase
MTPIHVFECVPLPVQRSREKPRKSGLTMMMDWGEPLGALDDMLALTAPIVDLAKLVVGTARFYPERYLRDKLALYRRHGVRPFLGGQFLEYVFATQGWEGVGPFLAEAERLGLEAIEVSDNCVPLNDAERTRMIGLALEAGLEVHGEVGSKTAKQDPADLVRQAEVCFRSGCDIVLVEAAEIAPGGVADRALINALRQSLDVSRLLFELPGWWIKGTTASDVFELQKLLVAEFGPDANIANVQPYMLLNLEALRCGLSVFGPSTRRG